MRCKTNLTIVTLCLLGEVLSIQGAFSPSVEPFSCVGLQQPLEDYGHNGYGGKVSCSLHEHKFSIRPEHNIEAFIKWFDSSIALEAFKSIYIEGTLTLLVMSLWYSN